MNMKNLTSMYRVYRYTEYPQYWPAEATVYVDSAPGTVEEYVTDTNGTPTLVGNYIGTVTYPTFASFPTVGRTNRMYIDGSTNLLYRWTGTAYVMVGGTSIIPTLDDVLTSGNTSFLDAFVNSIGVWDSAGGGFATIVGIDGGVQLTASNGICYFGVQDKLLFFGYNGIEVLFDSNLLTTSRIYHLPDADGTIALTSDITITDILVEAPLLTSGGSNPTLSTKMATNRLIGRSTAGQGVMEEIVIGTGLSLTGGTLSYTSPLTTKGDIFVRSTVDTRLAVGSDGQYLVVDSTKPTGLKWQTLSALYVPYSGYGTNNVSANNFFDGFTSVVASGTLITLNVNSTPSYLVTGSGGQTIKLPDATTLPNGAIFDFNNNQSSGTISVNNNSNTLVKSVPSGTYLTLTLTDNSSAPGGWDAHFQAPSNAAWSTNTLDWVGSFTNGTWNGNVVQVNRGGTGASTLTGYVKGAGTTALTAVSTIPTTDLSGTVSNAQLANSAITINGSSISLGSSVSVGTVTSVTGTAPVSVTGTSTPVISMDAASTSNNGYLKSTDWTTFNNKQNSITLTTIGTSGAASLVGATLNIPQYSGGGSQKLETIIAWDGNGSFITGTNTRYAVLSNGGTISGWSIVAIGTSPTCTIDIVYIAPGGTTLPSASICGSALPSLSTGNSIYSTTLTGWTTAIAAGGTLGFRIAASSNVLQLKITLIYS